ncbi:MAG: hypothetical protein ACRD2G_00115 [Terriglobia bacterium]
MTAGEGFDGYRGNPIIRAAVERQFEITGEAVARLIRLDEGIAAKITECRRIVSFRGGRSARARRRAGLSRLDNYRPFRGAVKIPLDKHKNVL